MVEVATLLDVLLGETGAQAVVVDEDVGGAAVGLVEGDGCLERLDGRDDDGFHALLVDRHLDGDPWRSEAIGIGAFETWLVAGVVARIGGGAANGTNDLEQVGEDDEEKEQTDADEERDRREEGEADVGSVEHAFADELADVEAEQEADAETHGAPDKEGRSAHHRPGERLWTLI